MGLLKSAMYTAGGVYAVNQLFKATEKRHERGNAGEQSSGSRQPQFQPSESQHYYRGQDGTYQSGHGGGNNWNDGNRQQQSNNSNMDQIAQGPAGSSNRWYSPQDNAWYPYPPGYQQPPPSYPPQEEAQKR